MAFARFRNGIILSTVTGKPCQTAHQARSSSDAARPEFLDCATNLMDWELPRTQGLHRAICPELFRTTTETRSSHARNGCPRSNAGMSRGQSCFPEYRASRKSAQGEPMVAFPRLLCRCERLPRKPGPWFVAHSQNTECHLALQRARGFSRTSLACPRAARCVVPP